MTVKQLQELQSNPPSATERVDASDFQIDTDAPALQRAEDFLDQIKNPYAYQCAGVAVNVRFCNEGKSLEQAVRSYLTAHKNNA